MQGQALQWAGGMYDRREPKLIMILCGYLLRLVGAQLSMSSGFAPPRVTSMDDVDRRNSESSPLSSNSAVDRCATLDEGL